MHDHGHHETFPVETEQPDNGRLFVYGLIIAMTFFGFGIMVTTLFYRANAQMLLDRGARPSGDLVQLRQAEEARLSGYSYVDKDKGVVRIPVERAMRLLVEEAQKR